MLTDEQIIGHYELQPNEVNGRPYFKKGSHGFLWGIQNKGSHGFWWDGIQNWWIGDDSDKGQSIGFAYYEKDVFCPHQLSELNWELLDGTIWYSAGNDLDITCKYNFIQNKAY